MRRYEVLKEIMNVVGSELVICNIGHPSQELFKVADRPQNFYMLGSMGLASSIGLGLAMATPKQVVVIDGDAAVTMNLGTFATIAKNGPNNLIHIIVDNQANGSTGFQDSFTASGLKLDEVARAAGIASTWLVDTQAEIAPTLENLLQSRGPHVMVIKAEIGMPDGVAMIPLDADEIRDRFVRSIFETP